MILVPTDILHIALTGAHEDIAVLCLEADIDAEEKESKEKSKEKEKNKISPETLNIVFGADQNQKYSSKKKYNRTIKPKVLHLEVYTPPPELL